MSPREHLHEVAGFLDGLAEARPEPDEVAFPWLAVGRAGMAVPS